MSKRFAQIDADGLVVQVIVADSLEWCEQNLGGTWVETFKDRSARFNYASIGYTYDSSLDAFLSPKPYASWSLDTECQWQAPIPMPEDGAAYTWNEETQTWEVVEIV